MYYYSRNRLLVNARRLSKHNVNTLGHLNFSGRAPDKLPLSRIAGVTPVVNLPTSFGERSAAESTLHVLKEFARGAHVAYDSMLAARVLSEAERAVDGHDPLAWTRRLVETGESLNLRIRGVEGKLEEAITFVRQGVPVAFCRTAADGNLEWIVLNAAKGRRVRLAEFQTEPVERWIYVKKVPGLLGLNDLESTTNWVIGQPALACQAPQDSPFPGIPKGPIPPLARLAVFLRPEKKDIWIVLVFSLVVGLLALATPVAVEALVNTVAFGRYLQPIIVLAMLLFTFLAFAGAMRGLITYVVELLQRRLFVRVVEDLAYRLPRVQQQEFDTKHGPELVNRFFDVVTLQKSAASLLLDAVLIVLQTVIGMAVLAFYHPFLLGFDVVLVLLVGITVFGLGRGAVGTAIKESKAKYAVAAWLEELSRHPTAFKLHAGSQFALERADQLAVHWLDARRVHFRIVLRQILFAFGLQAVAATALLGLGGWLVIQGELTLGQLVAAELIVMMIVGSFAKFGKHMESFYDVLASVDKLGALFDLNVETHDKLFHLREGAPAAVGLCDVSYRHQGETTLDKLNMEFSPGETVALVGPGGSGKSTVMDLICGLRSPTSGHVELDGIDLRELRPDSIRDHMGLARGVEIFAGTINENVHLNRPHISPSDVRDSLEMVGLLEEVLVLPEGLNTDLQTNGAPLTASQSARLMLARAICGRPRLLMIDGTLDGLPDVVAMDVLQSLTQNQVPWTLLISTGRRELMDGCDRVVSLQPDVFERKSHS